MITFAYDWAAVTKAQKRYGRPIATIPLEMVVWFHRAFNVMIVPTYAWDHSPTITLDPTGCDPPPLLASPPSHATKLFPRTHKNNRDK